MLSATYNEGRMVFHMASYFKEIEVFQGIYNLAKGAGNRTRDLCICSQIL